MSKCPAYLPAEPTTLVDLLHWRALHQTDRLAYTFLQDGETDEAQLTYGALDQQARAIATQLRHFLLGGERVLLLYQPGLEYIAAFFGCLYAGAVAVPAYPPRPNRSLARLQTILNDAQAAIALTTTSILSKLEQRFTDHEELLSLKWLTTDNLDDSLADSWQAPAVHRDTLAVLQYTSGSTAAPKGVMLTHRNLLHNSALIHQCFEDTPESQGVSWLPPYHDMGLIGGVIQPLYVGAPMALMSPVSFLQKPLRWLQAISRYRATTSGGPNFAYDLCIRKTTPEQRAALDLRSWKLAFSGAEPIQSDTLRQFADAFGPAGFEWEAFYPCYGLAEATLCVTGGLKSEPPLIQAVEESALAQNQVIPVSAEQEASRLLVSCGRSLQQVVIVDPDSCLPCLPNTIGEIWIADSDSIAQGYWNHPEKTNQTFRAHCADTGEGPFLRTGDLGFLQEGQLFVTGRLKDLIIIRGRNHYPHDIELTVEQSHPALRPGCGAAFSIPVGGEERLAIAQEVERSYLRDLDVSEVITAIRRAVSEHHDLQVVAIALLKTGSIPKTSSGKIQRHACRAGFLDGSLNTIGDWQLSDAAGRSASDGSQTAMVELHFEHNGHSAIASQPGSSKPDRLRVGDSQSSPNSQQRTDDLIQWLRTYARDRIDSCLIDEQRCIPPHLVLDFGNRGLLGMQVPELYGGLALSHTDLMRVMQQLGAIDSTLALFVGLNNALGIRPILNYATPTLRDELLPLLASGRELAAFALAEPGAGDAQAIATRAVPYGSGGWTLHGTKSGSSLASWASVITVFVQTLDASGQTSGVSGFVVRQGTPGLRVGPEAPTAGLRGLVQNRVYLDGVPVDRMHLLGDSEAGMAVAEDAILYHRLAIAAASVGGMKRCAQWMLRDASRHTGSDPVTLARMSDLTAAIAAVETLVTEVAEGLDRGISVPMEAYLVCNVAGSEFFGQAADHLVQLLGDRGGLETHLASQMLRDAHTLRVLEEPTETLTILLGSRMVNQPERLEQFLRDQLNAASLAHQLRSVADQIRDRCLDVQSFETRSAAMRWAYLLIGEVAMYGVLLAAVQATLTRSPSDSLRGAAVWLQLRLDRVLATALQGNPAESFLSAAQATDWISGYADGIGSLEQTWVREENTLGDDSRQNGHLFCSNGASSNSHPPETHPSSGSANSAGFGSDRMAQSIQSWMIDWLVRELQIEATSVDPTQAFADYGLDSVTAVEFANALEDWLGISLSPTLAYEYPTIEAMSRYLAGEVQQVGNGSDGRQSAHGHSGTGAQTDVNLSADVEIDQLLREIPDAQAISSSGDAEVDQILAELEQLSAVDAQRLLGNQTK